MILIGDTPPLRFCRGCGCDDNHACVGTLPDGRSIACSWVLLDIAWPAGICSACAEELGWDMRALATIAEHDMPAHETHQLVLP